MAGQPIDSNGLPIESVQLTGSSLQNDGTTSPVLQQMAFNSASYDRWRNNIQGTLLASATRTGPTTTTPQQTNYNATGVILFLSVTAASGTGGLILRVQMVDPVSGNVANMNAAPTAITAPGNYVFQFFPGVSGGSFGANTSGIQQTESKALPRTWQVIVSHGDSTNYTYSLGYSLVLG